MQNSNMANPFGRNIMGEYFVGREAELRRFQMNLSGLRNHQPNHEYVAGLEGTGKTYYLHKIAEIARSENFVGSVLILDPGVTPHVQIRTILGGIIDGLQQQWHSVRPNEPQRTELKNDWDTGPQTKLFRHPRQDSLIVTDLKQDFLTLDRHVTSYGFDGVVLCLDEGQRIEPLTLSGLKNALEDIGTVQIVLSWRLSSDAGGALEAGRREIRDRATAAEQDQGAARLFGTGTAMGPFATDAEVRTFFTARLSRKTIQFADEVCIRLGAIADGYLAELSTSPAGSTTERFGIKFRPSRCRFSTIAFRSATQMNSSRL
jgi:hypothetical protein